jgi:3-hydroxybutyryl-CoA dehydrogenase
MSETIKQIAVIGAGTMGHGIAQVSAVAGYSVILNDASEDMLSTASDKIRASMDVGVQRGKLTEAERHAALSRIIVSDNITDTVFMADLVIEAVPEKLELKQAIFRQIAELVPPQTILATNTSSLPVSAIANVVPSPGRFIGMHFFNPVPAMKLIELVRGAATDETTVSAARDFAESLGKTPIVVHDSPGFATSRLGVVLGLEAIRMLEQGVASAEDIDRAMELGYNHPVGPLKLTDLVGLDIRLAIADYLHETFGQDTYAAPALLRQMVAEGKLGKKSGEGFYSWT